MEFIQYQWKRNLTKVAAFILIENRRRMMSVIELNFLVHTRVENSKLPCHFNERKEKKLKNNKTFDDHPAFYFILRLYTAKWKYKQTTTDFTMNRQCSSITFNFKCLQGLHPLSLSGCGCACYRYLDFPIL